MAIKIYEYAGCSTCKKALKYLEARKVNYEKVPIVEHPPTVSELKAMLGYLKASGKTFKNLFNTSGEQYRALTPVEHPVVRVHPETGRKGLFVNPGFVSHVKDVSDAESRSLLDLFYAHITKPEHIVRHRWSVGDVAMWDNRSTVHYANRDYGDQRRVMHRITLRGDQPIGPTGA